MTIYKDNYKKNTNYVIFLYICPLDVIISEKYWLGIYENDKSKSQIILKKYQANLCFFYHILLCIFTDFAHHQLLTLINRNHTVPLLYEAPVGAVAPADCWPGCPSPLGFGTAVHIFNGFVPRPVYPFIAYKAFHCSSSLPNRTKP